jgi:hypothetical protein
VEQRGGLLLCAYLAGRRAASQDAPPALASGEKASETTSAIGKMMICIGAPNQKQVMTSLTHTTVCRQAWVFRQTLPAYEGQKITGVDIW